MDPLHFCIAIVPVSVYMLLIGGINLSRRAFLTTGARDLAALAMAVSGFMMAGPMELFLPETAAAVMGGWVWLPLILLYAFVVTLFLFLMRPRLVAYNISAAQLRPILEETLFRLDPTVTWAGTSALAPKLGIQVALEAYPGIRNVALASVGPEQDLDGWHQLKVDLSRALTDHPQPANAQGVSFIFLSLLLAGTVIYSLITSQQEIARGVVEMLRL